jgi:hypothetical protein
VGKVITLWKDGGTGNPPGPDLRELRLSTGLEASEFAAAVGKEAGEPVPTFVYLAYEGDEPPPPSIVRAAQRVSARIGREARRSRQATTMDDPAASPTPRIAVVAAMPSVAGLPHGPMPPDGPADHDYVAGIWHAIHQIVNTEVTLGGDELAPLALRQLRVARRRLDQGHYEAPIERELQAALAELAEVAAWMLHDAGNQDAARQVGYEALHLARLAGAPQRIDLFILGNLAHVEIFTGRPGAALQIARHALDGGNLSSGMAAMFEIRKARALAQLGDTSGTVRALESARSHLLDGVSAADPPWAWWLDEPELVHHTGQAFASLGVHNRALPLLEQANEDCPSNRVSGRFIYLAHSLTEAVAARAWNDAELIVEQVTPYAQDVGSGRAVSVLRDAIDCLEKVSVKPELRDAARHLRAALPAAAIPIHSEGTDIR